MSTCPNDTFAIDALLRGLIDTGDLNFEFELLDIQQLNDRLFAGDFDVAKTSFHAALRLADRVTVLPSGSALGFGVGPLLLSAVPGTVPDSAAQLTLCPGGDTTATLLMKLFYPDTTRIRQVVFSEIMPELRKGTADFGVCIHEGRFTWAEEGLHLVEDLGTRWEKESESPLPLGGLVVRDELPIEVMRAINDVIRRSIRHARADPTATLPTMRRYAQAFSDDVLMRHVELYVNDWTVDLGDVGRGALQTLFRLAKRAGVVPKESVPLSVLET